jgi:anti-sigma B factor antagonist
VTAMDMEVRTVDGVTVVVLAGDLDGRAAPAVQHGLADAVHDGRDVVLDLSGVGYLSSGGLRVLLLLYRRAQCLGRVVVVVGLSAETRQLLRATGFLDFFRLAGSVRSAVRTLRAEAAS